YDEGYEQIAMQKFYDYITTYPSGAFITEANTLLAGLLAKGSNYAEAFDILSKLNTNDDHYTRNIYQQVAIGRAVQLMQNKEYKKADSILNLSLNKAENIAYTSIAYFWKAEIAFLLNNA